jgi:hypothetical protein
MPAPHFMAVRALDRTQPILPLRQGIPEQQTRDYIRNGTTRIVEISNAVLRPSEG